MSVAEVLNTLQEKTGLSMYALGRRLGLKSSSHVWQLKKGVKTPDIHTCISIIELGKELEMDITLEMLRVKRGS